VTRKSVADERRAVALLYRANVYQFLQDMQKSKVTIRQEEHKQAATNRAMQSGSFASDCLFHDKSELLSSIRAYIPRKWHK
jgi:hypothetical protein